MLPVRILHQNKVIDCGTVACQECHERWRGTTKGTTALACPRCREPLIEPTERGVVDSLLLRLMGGLKARCTHCSTVGRVDDMRGHRRTSDPRPGHIL